MNEIKTFKERKEELVKKGKENGYITYEQLADALKGLDLDADSLDDLYNAFSENNIAVLSESDVSVAAFWSELIAFLTSLKAILSLPFSYAKIGFIATTSCGFLSCLLTGLFTTAVLGLQPAKAENLKPYSILHPAF